MLTQELLDKYFMAGSSIELQSSLMGKAIATSARFVELNNDFIPKSEELDDIENEILILKNDINSSGVKGIINKLRYGKEFARARAEKQAELDKLVARKNDIISHISTYFTEYVEAEHSDLMFRKMIMNDGLSYDYLVQVYNELLESFLKEEARSQIQNGAQGAKLSEAIEFSGPVKVEASWKPDPTCSQPNF